MEIGFGIQVFAIVGTEPVSKKGKGTLSDDFWIELFDRPGGGVARIGESWQACFVAFFIHRSEGGVRHENFTTDFKDLRNFEF